MGAERFPNPDGHRTARLIDGRALASRIVRETRTKVDEALPWAASVPGLAVVLVGASPASHIYVEAKLRKAREVGIATFEHRFDDIDERGLLDLVERLNADPRVHGILVQLPLPSHVDHRRVLTAVSPDKDADGFHPLNQGRLLTNSPGVVPCTPRGCLELIRQEVPQLEGLDAVVVGASSIVGRPMAALLLNQGCTVAIGHKSSRELSSLTRRADVLVVAAGQPGLIRKEWVKPGAIVVDVGISRVPDLLLGSRIVGDVAFDEVSGVAGAITPVPGGVGPMTVAMLMANTVDLFLRALNRLAGDDAGTPTLATQRP
jgi:methylenetetrahydrofolate dehydrogenase (NADP+)/methenyltetrahydrofolate cyclohydrolase